MTDNTGALGVSGINNMTFVAPSPNTMPGVFNGFAGLSGLDPATVHNILYSSGGAAPAQALLGLRGNLAALFGGFGAGGGAGGGASGASGTQYSWAPGMPVSSQQQALLAAQPPEFWNGVVDNQHLGLGRINFPGTGGGGSSFGL